MHGHRSIALSIVIMAALALHGAAAGQPMQWNRLQFLGPAARHASAMAYDSARGVAVLFGGQDDRTTTTYGDTWEWDGSAWSRRATTGPRPQNRHAMCYDSARGRTVLLGAGGETWEWDGTAWSLRATALFGNFRAGQAMVYDAARGQVVMFGGENTYQGILYGDTWTWDGTAWTQLAAPGPSPRVGAAMVYDSARQVCVLFGGQIRLTGNTSQAFSSDETWEWNGSAWTQRAVAGPSAREGCGTAFDSARGVTVLYGGTAVFVGDYGDTWEYNGNQWTQSQVQTPGPQALMPMVYDAARARTIVFSGWHPPTYALGSGGSANGDTWGFEGLCTPPVITQQSTSLNTCFSNLATASVVAGPGPLSYQWLSGDIVSGVPIAGANASSLTVSPGSYVCVIQNACGSVVSTLIYAGHCYTDFDCNDHVEVADIFAFLRAWFAGDLRADSLNDGVLTIGDIYHFIGRFFQNSC